MIAMVSHGIVCCSVAWFSLACYMCDIARHCMHSAASMSRQSVTCYGILGHITPWADIASHVMVCVSMKVHAMALHDSYGVTWHSML